MFKRVLSQRGDGPALQAVALMQQGTGVELTAAVALAAATLSLREKLPMADSIVLATARAYGASFWTQDSDFSHVEGVKYTARKTAG